MDIPSWVRPRDLKSWKYWGHLVIISIIVLWLLQQIYGGNMFNFANVLFGAVLIGVADISAHTILRIE